MRHPASISRDLRDRAKGRMGWLHGLDAAFAEAADCIDTLPARADKAETALRRIARINYYGVSTAHRAAEIARAALGEDPS